jgi:hypothetical protein
MMMLSYSTVLFLLIFYFVWCLKGFRIVSNILLGSFFNGGVVIIVKEANGSKSMKKISEYSMNFFLVCFSICREKAKSNRNQ